jgi:acetyl esterase/lipase
VVPAGVIRVDVEPAPLDSSVAVHIRGRGLAGLSHAVDAWWCRRVDPGRVVAYGTHPDQHALVRGSGRWTSVLIHGGYWRSRWAADLMEPLALALARDGAEVWNVEYRRPDEHGWATTAADVSSALRAVPSDRPVVTIGHSVGGQLALRACAAEPVAALAVSLAGVLDLERADRLRLSEGAVEQALGHRFSPSDATSSPRHRLPLGISQIVACGTDDDPNLLEISREYARAAAAAGDKVTSIYAAGDHFDIINPETALWRAVRDAIGDPARV